MDDKTIAGLASYAQLGITFMFGIVAYFFKKTITSIEKTLESFGLSIQMLIDKDNKVNLFLNEIKIRHNQNHPDNKIGE